VNCVNRRKRKKKLVLKTGSEKGKQIQMIWALLTSQNRYKIEKKLVELRTDLGPAWEGLLVGAGGGGEKGLH